VHIRRANRSDVLELGRLGALLVRAHHDFDPRRFIAPPSGTASGYAEFLGAQLEEQDVILLVAELEESVVGYTYATVEDTDWMSLRGPAGNLHDIVVDEAHRGRGVGRQLLDATVAELKVRGVPQVVLDTAAGNVSAQRLFERAGFRRTMIEMTQDLGGALPGPATAPVAPPD
jgi:ribosomal protein S18 acetylase RimI-like enzyme